MERTRSPTSMTAVVHRRYGAADQVLSVEEIDTPCPGDDEVLVRVHAASIHPDVWHVVEGLPLALRLFGNGLLRPTRNVPGTDLAGRVEAVGKNVTRFTVGDDVFGESVQFGWWNGGAYAEYAAVPQDFLVLKPANITFDQAAVVPTSGFIALSNLGMARSFAGTHVLINGGGGCVGTLAIQIARSRGAVVTAVDCTAKLGLMRSLGADCVIDYTKEDVSGRSERYDFVLDVASTLSQGAYKRILATDGIYLPIGHAHFGQARGRMGGRIVGSLPYFVSRLLLSLMIPRKGQAFRLPTKQQAMSTLKALIESGDLTPIVARVFGLADVAGAMRCMQDQNTLGRVVIAP
jgi:NADPH:quinone reductase-like Zn-dependent oxidoreductase